MTDTLKTRGPDQSGIWLDKDTPLTLGHRRLSIMDLSDAGRQPMESASKRYVIVYNGEIYNMLTLRSELEAKDISFRGHSDTEIILSAIDTWGINQTLQKINGMFSFVLWDKKERNLHFARDRLGKKPLYIGWAGNALVFGSELKALHAHPDFKATINKESVASYMRYAYVPAPSCIYKDVWQLLPGHRLTLNLNHLNKNSDLFMQMEPYWQASSAVENAQTAKWNGSDHDLIDEFENLLTQCTQDRMLSDVPLGAFLSGGIDSSTIVALMQAQSNQKIKTYSIGFDKEGFDEAIYARQVAEHLGTDHHELYISEQDAMAVIPSLPNIYDEPFADISALPTSLLSQFARQDVTVAMSGDGGDEMLGGYNRHIKAPGLWQKFSWMPSPLRHVIARSMQAVSTDTWDKALPFKPQAGTAAHKLATLIEQSDERGVYDALCSHWQSYGTPTELPDIKELSFSERMMLWDSVSYLSGDVLTKVDRASMAHSLEVRSPLLDTRIFEFAWKLPFNTKIRNGTGKWILQQVLKKHVPHSLFDRPKQGFSMPIGSWLRGTLRTWADDLLSEQKLQDHGLLDTAEIRRVWEAHQRGAGDHATKLWTALMFQAWYQRWKKI